ncbi:MAG TPA: hypothetical protein ENN67_01035 [Firmicutes bacterium]|nr:hypothetical protein [Bacillota bacterium]
MMRLIAAILLVTIALGTLACAPKKQPDPFDQQRIQQGLEQRGQEKPDETVTPVDDGATGNGEGEEDITE